MKLLSGNPDDFVLLNLSILKASNRLHLSPSLLNTNPTVVVV